MVWRCLTAHLRVCQVSNHHGGDACYQDRVSHQLVACVSQLAVAAGKDTLWKQLNNELLLTTRHSKPEVDKKYSSVETVILDNHNQCPE